MQGSAHGGRRCTVSTLDTRPPQQLEKTSKTEYSEYKNYDMKIDIFDAKTAHHYPMSGQDPGHVTVKPLCDWLIIPVGI